MPLTDYPATEFQPHNLTQEEINDPYLVIDNLFDFAHLPDLREIYWEWLKTTVTNTYDRHSPSDCCTIMALYEKLGKLIEAVHILHQQKKKRPE